MMILYTFKLKHIVIVDILIISGGFILRAISGAVVLDVMISRWLIACTIFLSLFLILAKRRNEIIELGSEAAQHRAILQEYGVRFLDQMIAVTTASFVMAYSLYTFSATNLPKNHEMMLTIPFALYVVFRLLYLVHIKNAGGSPEEMVLRDKPLFISLILWGVVSVGILYFFGKA